MRRLALDEGDDAAEHLLGGHEEPSEADPRRPRRPAQLVEQVVQVGAQLGVCREQSEVRVDRRGRGVVVPRPDVGVTAERAALASHHETDLRVRLHVHQAVHHVDAGPLQLLGPVHVARFDEERNVDWAKKLERAGIHVVYGLVDVKTHAKIGLVVRREGGALRSYAHVGTGNYNAATAAVYTDLGLLTAHPELGADVNDLFNELSGSSRPPRVTFRRLLVAPEQMLERLLALVNREAEYARAGRGGRIRAKLNGLADAEVIGALYRASQAGVEIDLVCRGICWLRPRGPGLSDRIRVISILGRFLEHGRIFSFANGGEPEAYIGAADWRPRNLRRRVGVATPILDPRGGARLERILDMELADPAAGELGP